MPGGTGRETQRPPWVKDAKGNIPAKETPAWTLRKRTSNAQDTEVPAPQNAVEEQLASVKASLKKQTTRNRSENGVTDKKNDDGPEKVTAKVKELPSKEKKAEPEKSKKPLESVKEPPAPKEIVTPKKPPPIAKPPPPKEEAVAKKPPVLQRQLSKEDGGKKWRDPLIEKAYEKIDSTLNEIPKGHTLTKNESLRSE